MDLKIAIKADPILKGDKFKEKFDDNVKFGIGQALIHYQNQVVRNLTSGKFKIKTDKGTLRNSLVRKILKKPGEWIGRLGTNLIYARIQEKGGKINVSRKMSKFAWFKFSETGDVMWKAIALKKGTQIKIPAHFYLQRTLKEEKRKIASIVERALVRGFT